MNASSSLLEGVWLREELATGRRDWLTVAHRYTRRSQFREAITAAINSMVWYPPGGQSLPWWPAVALQQMVRDANSCPVASVAVSDTAIAIPEQTQLERVTNGPARLEAQHPDATISYSLVGVRQLTAQGWLISYWLDQGTDLCGVALDTRPGRATRSAAGDLGGDQ